MNPEILPLLACPSCRESDPASLALSITDERHGRIWEGALSCPICQKEYPIHHGIPRFVSVEALHDSQQERLQGEIAQNFGDAWQLYAETRRNPYTEEQVFEWLQPLTPSDFTGQVVLDLGSGLGGFAEYIAQTQPRHIIGLEISHAIDAAIPLLEHYPCLSLVQGNILQPPFRPESFNLIYSVGVLHHLDNPELGVQRTVPLVKPQGRFFFWVYGRENNEFVIYCVDPLRRLASLLPVTWVRYGLAWPLSLPLYLLLHTLYHPTLSGIFGGLPYHRYFQWLRKYGFGYVVGMVTDQLVPPRTHYLSRPQVVDWLERAALTLESITPRNNISWRVLGRKNAS